jgi:hypothetical protein
MRISARQKRKESRKKWSRNANAAKARKRLERIPNRWPQMEAFFPWSVTLENKLDGAKFKLDLNSARHCKRFCDFVLAHYEPECRYGGQERL